MNFQHIDPDDLALLALQFLPAEETAAMRAHLERCSECRANLAELQGDLALFALSSEPHSPPAAARDRLLSQVAREPKPQLLPMPTPSTPAVPLASQAAPHAPVDRTRESLANRHDAARESRPTSEPSRPQADSPLFGAPVAIRKSSTGARLLPWAGWAVAAGFAVAFGLAAHDQAALRSQVDQASREVVSVNHQMAQLTAQTNAARRVLDTLNDPSAQRVTLTLSRQHPVPQGKATYVPGKGELVFMANNLEPLAPLKTYELWVIPSNGQSPIPAGTFHPDEHGNANVLLPNLPTGVSAKAFGVTIEDEGGSPTPTMPIILAGAAPAAGE